MKLCANCDRLFDDSWKVCLGCGQPLTQAPVGHKPLEKKHPTPEEIAFDASPEGRAIFIKLRVIYTISWALLGLAIAWCVGLIAGIFATIPMFAIYGDNYWPMNIVNGIQWAAGLLSWLFCVYYGNVSVKSVPRDLKKALRFLLIGVFAALFTGAFMLYDHYKPNPYHIPGAQNAKR